MFDKSFLVNKVVNSLQKNDFETFVTRGCFDVVGKKKELYLLKVLMNVDGLSEEHAMSLRAISYFLSAHPFVLSLRNNRERLSDDTIYSRFELPVVTPELFEEMLDEEIVVRESAKGRHTITIDVENLRMRRKELKLTLDELSESAGISKKALYEIENQRVNPTEETVKKLESVLSMKLSMPYKSKQTPITYLIPKNEFQEKVSKEFSRIGIDNSSVHHAPFEIVGREDFSLITSLSQNTLKIEKEVGIIKKLSSVFSSRAIFIARKSTEENMNGIPVLLESELKEIENVKELSKIIEEKI